jgi:penicillin-binding protein 2
VITITREDAGRCGNGVLKRPGAPSCALPPEDIDDIGRKEVKDIDKRLADLRADHRQADRLSWEEFSRVAVNAPALPGVHARIGACRGVYPRDADFAHVLGYVGPVSDYDLSKMENPDPVLLLPEFQIGKVGAESKLEGTSCAARPAPARIEVNAAGREMRELDRQEGTAGRDLQMTLDAGCRITPVQRLGEESAAAVVIDVTNGDLMAIVSNRPLSTRTCSCAASPSTDYKA